MPEKNQKALKRTHHFSMAEKECIIVVGPTAVGKTAEAIKIATALKTDIISADSRQCYKEMKIGVARPSDAELSMVRHHFIANHSIHENITAASFEKEALTCLDIIFQNHDQAVVCGGTGLYIKALAEGLDDIPEVPIEVRNKAISIHKDKGVDGLRDTLLSLDPEFALQGDIYNPNRMMRALEVILHTGISDCPLSKRECAKTSRRRPAVQFWWQKKFQDTLSIYSNAQGRSLRKNQQSGRHDDG
jgi:tRNA dimethylallyltransferase